MKEFLKAEMQLLKGIRISKTKCVYILNDKKLFEIGVKICGKPCYGAYCTEHAKVWKLKNNIK